VPSPSIELRNVSFSFGRESLLRDVSISVAQGETLVLIGPSGQGKTTLLKVMAGLLTPTIGEAFIEGHNLATTKGREREALAKKMGMLFQKNALFDSLTCAENVAFPMREVGGYAKAPDQEVMQIANSYLDAVGILHAKDLLPDEISGGMQKRLGIARALALKPSIVFYDDPTAGLDPITSRKIVQLIEELKQQSKATIVAVTNDMHRAYQMANRIAMVIDNEVIDCGTPEQTQANQDPRVMQFIRGRLEGPLTVQA
jgi:phospholipid/cholesterol/gamma-HCH transport system ATP-binding protein